MGKYSHVRLAGGASCALLLGALVFPATVVSQVDANSDGKKFAPAEQPPNQYGAGPYGMTPGGSGGYPPPNYGPNYGSDARHGPHGAPPFDRGDASTQPPPQGYTGATGGWGMSAGMSSPPAPMPPMRGMHGYGAVEPGKMMPRAGQGGRHCPMGASGCAHHKPFMRRGMGMGMGMGLQRYLQAPNLTDEQRNKIHDISDELRREHLKWMGEKVEHSTQLRRLHDADPLDAKAIGAAYAKIFDIKRKMIEADIEADQKARDVLTDEQRKQLLPPPRP